MTRGVSVCARVRPFLKEEKVSDSCLEADAEDRRRLVVYDTRHKGIDREYELDTVYPAAATTSTIFNEQVAHFLPNVLSGGYCTVFAHGATGSGKTYTMQGSTVEGGLVELSVRALFKAVADRGGDCAIKLKLSFFEILQERVYDLLSAKPRSDEAAEGLTMRDDASGNVVIAGLTERDAPSADEVMRLWRAALPRRSVGRTALNEESSRSHSCLQIAVEPQCKGPRKAPGGRLFLVDLAGCEDNRKTDNGKDRMQESVAINSSHLALGKVLLALKKGSGHVPYRESKLTRLLKRALDGKNRTFMLLTLSPSSERFMATHSTFNSIQLEGRPIGSRRTSAGGDGWWAGIQDKSQNHVTSFVTTRQSVCRRRSIPPAGAGATPRSSKLMRQSSIPRTPGPAQTQSRHRASSVPVGQEASSAPAPPAHPSDGRNDGVAKESTTQLPRMRRCSAPPRDAEGFAAPTPRGPRQRARQPPELEAAVEEGGPGDGGAGEVATGGAVAVAQPGGDPAMLREIFREVIREELSSWRQQVAADLQKVLESGLRQLGGQPAREVGPVQAAGKEACRRVSQPFAPRNTLEPPLKRFRPSSRGKENILAPPSR
mmetsp:Transcript_57896/g.154705  ORF Transcript_57896/g.154705 Transcript_57896/m.154705 type:complete len:601 (+) Transcript_57896:22-1824(+)